MVGMAASTTDGTGCKNKPNVPQKAGKTIAKVSGLDDATPEGTNVRNEANFRRGQTRQTNPICPRRVRRTSAKASGLDDATPEGTNVRNEANFRRGRMGRGLGTGALGCCTNKPNFRGPADGMGLASATVCRSHPYTGTNENSLASNAAGG